MADADPPWLEITPDDYYPRARRDEPGPSFWTDAIKTVRDLLQRQYDGEFRLRLVLREAVDLKPLGKRDPLMIRNYEMGPETFLTEADVVIETRDGRRFLVPKTRGAEDARKPMRAVPLGRIKPSA